MVVVYPPLVGSPEGYPTIGKYSAPLFDKSCLSKTSVDFGFLISAKLVNLPEFTEKKNSFTILNH